jgi:hypothetical protein
MKLRHCSLALLCAAAVAAAAPGCGGDDSSAEPASIETSSIDKRQFIREAGAICARGNRWLLKNLSQYVADEKAKGSSRSQAELLSEAMKTLGLPRVEATIRDIRSLGAPAGDEAELEAFLTQLQQETDALQAQPQLSMRAVFVEGFAASGQLARDYGLEACAYS